MSYSSPKILVIGAGIAGTTLCYWLKRYGFSPHLIEKSPHLRKGGQALDLRGNGVDLVKKMGIYEQVVALRTQIELGRYVNTTGQILHEEKGERFGFREGDDLEILRGDLVEILMAAIEAVPCHFNQQIDEITQNERVNVRFKDGRIEQYDLVIGADGIHSSTRRMAFSESAYKLVNLGVYFSVFSIPNYLDLRHSEWQCEADHKLVSISSDKDPKRAQASFMFRSKHFPNLKEQKQQQQFLRDEFRDFGWEVSQLLELMDRSEDFYFDLASQVKMESWTSGRVALLGDAAYCASPLSGQGNHLALMGAYLLAGELKQSNGDYSRAFKRYNELLHPLVEATQRFGAWVSDSFLVSELSEEAAKKRADEILEKVSLLANMFPLPEYA